jgi:Adenylate and Guanylate cyclase catalytic domain/HAMP domain
MLVVTGVTGAALLVTQQEVAATYTKIFQERFRAEVELFAAAQEARLTAVKDKCRELGRSVRLIAALEEGDATLLYKIAFDELREVVSPEVPLRALRPAAFFRLIGADGGVLSPPDARAGLASPADRCRSSDLVAGTTEIQRGNFAVQVPLRSRDELGHLAGSFNAMARELELKERVRSVLDLIADKDVAEELVSGRLSLGGELRDVSILFCDIRGFTAFTERMQPVEVVDFLNQHMTALTAAVYEHRGVVDKFVGDLVMAIFGAPKSYGNDAYNAVRCAQAMIAARERLNVQGEQLVATQVTVRF